MRLHVFLAKAGVASRRGAEALIDQGRVRVNNKVISIQGHLINPDVDRVRVDGKSLEELFEKKRYFIFNKPRGVVTTLKDRHAEKTVADFFGDIPERLVPAGRLDKDSTGLILMTNDGELIHRLTHPRYQVQKCYRVGVRGAMPPEMIRRLEKGVFIQGRRTAPCKIKVLVKKGDRLELRFALHEGRKREIREMIKKAGAEIESLHRETYGPLRLGALPTGARRELAAAELSQLKNGTL